jgi:hypothetical protein
MPKERRLNQLSPLSRLRVLTLCAVRMIRFPKRRSRALTEFDGSAQICYSRGYENPRLRPDNVFRKARVVGQDTNEFAAEGSILRLITKKIQEGYEWRSVQVGCIQLIADNEINAYTLTDQSRGHTKCIRPVVSAGEKGDANRSRGVEGRPLYDAIAWEALTRSFQGGGGYARLLLSGHHEFQQ